MKILTRRSSPMADLSTLPQGRSRVTGLLERLAMRWGLVVAGLLAWEYAANRSTSGYFVPPSTIFTTTLDLWFSEGAPRFVTELFTDNVIPSLGRLMAAWLLAAAIGVSLGVLLALSRSAYDYVKPFLDLMRSIPSPALIPVFMVVLGLGNAMRISVITFVAVWPVLINTVEGVRGIDRIQFETAEAFNMGRLAQLRHIVIPGSSPQVIAGLRVALSLALNLLVLSELVASSNGLGFFVQRSQDLFALADMWSGVTLIVVIGLLLNVGFVKLEQRLLRWYTGERLN